MKYKEFWIDFKFGEEESAHQITDVSLVKLKYPYKNIFHVIEYQAYEKLQKQNEKLKDSLKLISKTTYGHKTIAQETLKEIEDDK